MKKIKTRYIAITLISLPLILALVVVLSFLRLDAFLPHDKVSIILPFDQQYDKSTRIIPMGETIHHPKSESPKGHPGIDFGSQESYPFIAAMDGKISKIEYVEGAGNNITLNNGAYNVVYAEMDHKNTYVAKGQKVKQGDKIALPYPKEDGGNKHYSVHWEFASISVIRDRFCPNSYFTDDSRQRIDAIWERVKKEDNSEMTKQFPHICSGDYYNRTD